MEKILKLFSIILIFIIVVLSSSVITFEELSSYYQGTIYSEYLYSSTQTDNNDEGNKIMEEGLKYKEIGDGYTRIRDKYFWLLLLFICLETIVIIFYKSIKRKPKNDGIGDDSLSQDENP